MDTQIGMFLEVTYENAMIYPYKERDYSATTFILVVFFIKSVKVTKITPKSKTISSSLTNFIVYLCIVHLRKSSALHII